LRDEPHIKEKIFEKQMTRWVCEWFKPHFKMKTWKILRFAGTGIKVGISAEGGFQLKLTVFS
jgi:hypothetical protein